MTYFGEFRVNWRTMAAAGLGMGFGFSLYLYISSLFAPHLIHEFGWSKAQLALLGTTYLVSLVAFPVVGRLTDIHGPRRIATVGAVAYPAIFVAMSATNGSFAWFFLLNLLLLLLVGSTLSSALCSRLIAQEFDRARGLALSVMASAAPASAAIIAPLLSRLIDAQGWRAGYLALAACTAISGVMVLAFMPRHRPPAAASAEDAANVVSRDYRTILRSPPFRIIAASIFLCCLTALALPAQLKLVLLDRGLDSNMAALMISFYTGGIVVGRVACGIALDRLPPHLVAAVSLGLPSLGLFILASGLGTPLLIGVAVAIIGLAMGAELDIATYLVMRYFAVEVYSSVYGLIAAFTALSGVSGSLLLSLTLRLTGDFSLFLLIGGVAMAACSLLILMLGRYPTLR